MIDATETFDGTWPYAPNFCDAAGFRQHYVDVGGVDVGGADKGAGEVIICLHGEPTWGYLYRNMIGPLSSHRRVIVPDHMGFGKSETPQDREYTLRSHVENLSALIDELGLENITLVMQDWGGLIGTGYTVRNPDRVSRLVYMNTLAGYGQPGDGVTPISESRWFRWIASGLESGRTEAVLRNCGSTVLSVMKIPGFQNSGAVDDTWIRAYSAAFPDAESAIGAYEFPLDALLGRIADYVLEGAGGVPALVAKPAILLEGMEDQAIPPDYAIADFRSLWPNAPVVKLPGVGHYCQEDAPDVLTSNIYQFMQS